MFDKLCFAMISTAGADASATAVCIADEVWLPDSDMRFRTRKYVLHCPIAVALSISIGRFSVRPNIVMCCMPKDDRKECQKGMSKRNVKKETTCKSNPRGETAQYRSLHILHDWACNPYQRTRSGLWLVRNMLAFHQEFVEGCWAGRRSVTA